MRYSSEGPAGANRPHEGVVLGVKTLAKAGITAFPSRFSVTSHLADALAQMDR